MPNRIQRASALVLFSLLLFGLVYCHQQKFDSPTPVSRLDLLHAIVVYGTVRIDGYHQNTPDKALYRDHYYSDKAPGTVVLAVPPFAIAVGLLRLRELSVDSRQGWLASSWFACGGSIGIITALGGLALFVWLSKYVLPRSALVTTLALFLGAAPLPYATMMFSHALVVGLLTVAIWAIEQQRSAVSRQSSEVADRSSCVNCSSSFVREETTGKGMWLWLRRNRWVLLAGHVCGWALASEYTSGIVILGLFVWLVSGGWRRAFPFCVAAIPPLLLIPAYSWVCFGDPFTLPYSYQASFPAMKEGLYAIKWPDAQTASKLLFVPARGLLFWSPFLIMAAFGYREINRISRHLLWLTLGLPLLQIVVISGRVWDWPAGPTLGPRYLAPILPLIALPCAFGVQKYQRLGVALGAYSVAITTLATLTDACPDFGTHPNPLFDLNIPLILKGDFSPNLGIILGLSPYVSVALFYAILMGSSWWIWWRLPKESAQTARFGSDVAVVRAE